MLARLEDHPLQQLLDAGIKCSINADDRLLFGSGIREEYEICRERLGFDDALPGQITTWSLEASAAPIVVVNRHVAGIEAWLQSE